MEANVKCDIVALGECLIDFVPLKSRERGKLAFSGCPGGAPANVLAAAAKLGSRTAFIGKVGDDVFGALLNDTLNDAGVITRGLVRSEVCPTTLAFVSLDANGDRSFSFYRRGMADCMLEAAEVDVGLIQCAKVFHIGSLSLTDEPSRSATRFAIDCAKRAGALISYDPNLREKLWSSLDEAKKMMLSVMGDADIVKVSEEELLFLTGCGSEREGMEKLYADYSLKLLIVTKAERGSALYDGKRFYDAEAYKVDTIDTTGAGDAFYGAFLTALIRANRRIDELDGEALQGMLRFASAAGSLATTKSGAIPSLPCEADICALLRGASGICGGAVVD